MGRWPGARIWAAVEPKLAPLLGGVTWLNLGGGHHVTRADYQTDQLVAFLNQLAERHGVQVYLEPGEAVALDATGAADSPASPRVFRAIEVLWPNLAPSVIDGPAQLEPGRPTMFTVTPPTLFRGRGNPAIQLSLIHISEPPRPS